MYNFPPIGIGRGVAWNYFADELARNGYSVEVVTTDPSMNDPYYNNAKIKEIKKTFKLTRLKDAKFYYKIYGGKPAQKSSDTKQNKRIVKSVIVKGYKNLSRLLFYPDRMRFWSKKAKKYLETKDIGKNDIIISVGFPFSTHLEMCKLKKKFGCKLILDYGDPWSFNPSVETEPVWRKGIDHFIESRIINKADLIIVTTNSTKEQFIKKFGIKNVEVVRLGVDLSVYKKYSLGDFKNDKLTLVYTGTFYKEIRDPSNFFDAITKTDKRIDYPVRMIFAGKKDVFVEELIKKYELSSLKNIEINFLGNIGIDECVKMQLSADILLFFSNKTGIQVPGKIYEYLATGKPVLCISYERAEAETILDENKCAIIINNSEDMVDSISLVLNEFKKDGKIAKLSLSKNYNYDWSNVSKNILKCVEEVDRK